MNYRKSAFPYLALLLVLVIGTPLANYSFEKQQHIKKEIKVTPVNQKTVPIASVL